MWEARSFACRSGDAWAQRTCDAPCFQLDAGIARAKCSAACCIAYLESSWSGPSSCIQLDLFDGHRSCTTAWGCNARFAWQPFPCAEYLARHRVEAHQAGGALRSLHRGIAAPRSVFKLHGMDCGRSVEGGVHAPDESRHLLVAVYQRSPCAHAMD